MDPSGRPEWAFFLAKNTRFQDFSCEHCQSQNVRKRGEKVTICQNGPLCEKDTARSENRLIAGAVSSCLTVKGCRKKGLLGAGNAGAVKQSDPALPLEWSDVQPGQCFLPSFKNTEKADPILIFLNKICEFARIIVPLQS